MFKKCVILSAVCVVIYGQQAMRTNDESGLTNYDLPFVSNGEYDENIQSPSEFLGFELGARPVRHWESKTYFEYLDATVEHVSLYSYGKTYEGRELIYLIVTSKENHDNIYHIQLWSIQNYMDFLLMVKK